jgi:feruloyl esterase
VFDAAFMADQRAALDFAEASVRTVDRGRQGADRAFYGRSIAHSYMTGCSTGGRESMLAAQRYPELFDGIVVGAPAMRTGHSNLAIEYSAVQFNQAAPRDAQGLPLATRRSRGRPQDRARRLLKQCDALDGRADGMIMNVAQCRFARPRCNAAATRTTAASARRKSRRWNARSPARRTPPAIRSTSRCPTTPGSCSPARPARLSADRQPGRVRPRDTRADDRHRRTPARGRGRRGAALTDTNVWTDLDTFLARGSKILFFHGVSDHGSRLTTAGTTGSAPRRPTARRSPTRAATT